jgi:nucleotide-binding universal stress UspA family protein
VVFPYRRILCPVDFDENSVRALAEAVGLAKLDNASIWLLHVVRINPLAREGLLVGELYDSQVQSSREKLAALAKEKLDGIDHLIVVEVEDPAMVILATEEKIGADLVVMATHGRRGIARLVLGSVAERVLRESRALVLTVRPASDEEPQQT